MITPAINALFATFKLYNLAGRYLLLSQWCFANLTTALDLIWVVFAALATSTLLVEVQLLTYYSILRPFTSPRTDRRPVHKPQNPPTTPSKPDDKDDKTEDLVDRLKKFWQKHGNAITITVGVILTAGVIYYFWPSLRGGRGDGDDSDDSPTRPDSPRTIRRRDFESRNEARGQLFRKLGRETTELENILTAPGMEDFSIAVVAVTTLFIIAKDKNYVFNNLKAVWTWGADGNHADDNIFYNVKLMLLRPDYVKTQAVSNILVLERADEMGREEDPATAYVYHGIHNAENFKSYISQTWLARCSGMSQEELMALSPDDFGIIAQKAFERFHSNPEVHKSMVKLASLVEQALPFCHIKR